MARHAAPTQRTRLLTGWKFPSLSKIRKPPHVAPRNERLQRSATVDTPVGTPLADVAAIAALSDTPTKTEELVCLCGHGESAHEAGECWDTVDGVQCSCDWWMPRSDLAPYVAAMEALPTAPSEVFIDYPDGDRVPIGVEYDGTVGPRHRWVAVIPRHARMINGMVVRVNRDTVLAVAVSDSHPLRVSAPPVPAGVSG